MKIAIHHRENSYSEYWIQYCKDKNIDFKIINCYDTDIIQQVEDCDIILWHWIFWHSRDIIFAKQLLLSLELSGKRVYPNIRSCQFYDDKIGQKYLLESLKLPLVKSYVFFYKQDAIRWINEAVFPKVFKLKGGAGSSNVMLVKSKLQALRLVRKSFNSGFSPSNRMENLKNRISRFNNNRSFASFLHVLKGIIRLLYPSSHSRFRNREKAYVFFQDFIPDNDSDIRVVVIGNRAFAIKRQVRKNDFRASGSGIKIYNPENIPYNYIQLAFDLNNKLKMQSVAFDFIKGPNGILLLEISYCWALDSFGKHPGYWTNDGVWHPGKFCPADFIIENMINSNKN